MVRTSASDDHLPVLPLACSGVGPCFLFVLALVAFALTAGVLDASDLAGFGCRAVDVTVAARLKGCNATVVEDAPLAAEVDAMGSLETILLTSSSLAARAFRSYIPSQNNAQRLSLLSSYVDLHALHSPQACVCIEVLRQQRHNSTLWSLKADFNTARLSGKALQHLLVPTS